MSRGLQETRDEVTDLPIASEEYIKTIEPVERSLYRSIWRILQDRNDADEALQNALETIWKRFEKVRKHPNPPALMMRIGMNAAYDLLRRKARSRNRETAGLPPGLPNGEAGVRDRLERDELRLEIHHALSRLSRKQAQAVLMRFVQELSFPEIASALGCREATARTHVRRGCAKLRILLSSFAPGSEQEVYS